MIDKLALAYRSAMTRLLIFDYDGVLAPIVDRPEQAEPSEKVRMLLRELSTRPDTKLVVVSGRDHETLESWLGDLPIDMSAEHGHFRRESEIWRTNSRDDMTWRPDVEAVMQQLVSEYPGSHIEPKHASLVWHYRQVSVTVDEVAVEKRIVQATDGRAIVMRGKCVFDVRAPGVDKGAAVRHWYDENPWDFVLCVGDDVTDESMFAALPASAWTIKVGDGPSSAKYSFQKQVDVVELLQEMSRVRS